MRTSGLWRWSGDNWFVLAVPLLAATAWLIARAAPWGQDSAGLEAALLIDACITAPLLYALCYGRTLPLWQVAVRMLGLACLGIYLIGLIVPPQAQLLLPSFGWARAIGVAVLLLFELWLLVAALRLVFGAGATAEEVQAKTGAPPLLARLMVVEARFWKAVWRLVRRGD